MNKKKILTTLGAAVAVATPIVAVVSCGSKGKPSTGSSVKDPEYTIDPSTGVKKFNLLPTYTGQEDQLIALGVKADYYPLQLNADKPFDYLLHPEDYMVMQGADFKRKFSKKIKELTPNTKGTSWWNQQALNSDEEGSDPAYWQKMEGGLLLYEHYLLDDDAKIIDNSIAPKHDPASTVQTNFRASRDPFTRIPKGVFFAWDFTVDQINKLIKNQSDDEKVVASTTLETDGTPGEPSGNPSGAIKITVKDLKIAKALKELTYDNRGNGGWTYNDKYFVDSFHRMFLDNKDFQGSNFAKWMVDSTVKSPFAVDALNSGLSAKVQKLFDASTFQQDEVKIGVGPHSTKLPHHPIYEQQEGEIGAAPMFEGAMRDNQLYLFNIAWQIDNIATYGTPYGEQHYNDLPDKIESSKRDANLKVAQSKEEADKVRDYISQDVLSQEQLTQVKSAFDNAEKITTQLQARMADMKTYFEALKTEVGQTEALKFGVLTIAPGHGESTIQTMSKYSFLYDALGFAQPVPNNIDDLVKGADKFTNAWDEKGNNTYLTDGKVATTDSDVKNAIGAGSEFNMDDNGWFWTMGESGDLSADRMGQFKDQFDLGVITARDDNYKAELVHDKSTNAPAAAAMFKGTHSDNSKFLNDQRVNYDLWNEGLKTPFVMHMILDQVMKQMETWAKDKGVAEADIEKVTGRDAAKDWGQYFTADFIK